MKISKTLIINYILIMPLQIIVIIFAFTNPALYGSADILKGAVIPLFLIVANLIFYIKTDQSIPKLLLSIFVSIIAAEITISFIKVLLKIPVYFQRSDWIAAVIVQLLFAVVGFFLLSVIAKLIIHKKSKTKNINAEINVSKSDSNDSKNTTEKIYRSNLGIILWSFLIESGIIASILYLLFIILKKGVMQNILPEKFPFTVLFALLSLLLAAKLLFQNIKIVFDGKNIKFFRLGNEFKSISISDDIIEFKTDKYTVNLLPIRIKCSIVTSSDVYHCWHFTTNNFNKLAAESRQSQIKKIIKSENTKSDFISDPVHISLEAHQKKVSSANNKRTAIIALSMLVFTAVIYALWFALIYEAGYVNPLIVFIFAITLYAIIPVGIIWSQSIRYNKKAAKIISFEKEFLAINEDKYTYNSITKISMSSSAPSSVKNTRTLDIWVNKQHFNYAIDYILPAERKLKNYGLLYNLFELICIENDIDFIGSDSSINFIYRVTYGNNYIKINQDTILLESISKISIYYITLYDKKIAKNIVLWHQSIPQIYTVKYTMDEGLEDEKKNSFDIVIEKLCAENKIELEISPLSSASFSF